MFATASDPFKSEEVGLVSVFEFPTEDALSSVTGMSLFMYDSFSISIVFVYATTCLKKSLFLQ